MSDFEMLSLVLMMLSIVVTILSAYLNQSKKVTAPRQRIAITFLEPTKFGLTVYQ